MTETPRDVAPVDPAQARVDEQRHGVPLGWVASSVSMRCRYGLDGCDDLFCACTCHDAWWSADAVRANFRWGTSDGVL